MHVEPPLIPLVKIMNKYKLEKYFVKIKFRRDPMSQKSDLYKLKMDLFDNGDAEEFLLFIRNFNMNPEASRTLRSDAKTQYLCTMISGEALHQFDTLSAEVGIVTPEKLTSIILGLGTYFYPINSLSK